MHLRVRSFKPGDMARFDQATIDNARWQLNHVWLESGKKRIYLGAAIDRNAHALDPPFGHQITHDLENVLASGNKQIVRMVEQQPVYLRYAQPVKRLQEYLAQTRPVRRRDYFCSKSRGLGYQSKRVGTRQHAP